ncbi:MAG: LptF/LptG family permease, partial [Planctomycetota bacterium]|nr:LptF/LptG family permease [Planctomycetota bacterium]
AGKLGVWSLFLPNLVLLLLGYGLWRAYERGWLGGVSGRVSALGADAVHLLTVAAVAFWRPFTALREYGTRLLRRKTDGYIAGSFLGPLLVVVLVVASLLTALDLVEHGTDVLEGVMKAREPLPGAPARTEGQAVLHVVTYYGIRALEMTCDLLPLLVLVAGVLCVTALVHNNEHLILKSSGLRLQRAFRPMLCVALVFSVAVAVLRETAMPGLIMTRDVLRPLVYRRAPAPTALALPTLDDQGRQVLFQMSQYASSRKEGKNLRVFELTKDGRMPVITADRAFWNGQAWQLETIPPPPAIGRGSSKDKGDGKDKPTGAPPRAPLPYGYLVSPEVEASPAGAGQEYGGIRPVHTTKSKVTEWRGAMTPAFLESERLGPGVMSMADLEAASRVKPELKVEWWRRVTEVAMGLFLLWLAIPLLVSERRGPVWGVGFSIAFGAAYWGLNMACAEGARQARLPVWSPVLVAALFLVLGLWQYYHRMET